MDFRREAHHEFAAVASGVERFRLRLSVGLSCRNLSTAPHGIQDIVNACHSQMASPMILRINSVVAVLPRTDG